MQENTLFSGNSGTFQVKNTTFPGNFTTFKAVQSEKCNISVRFQFQKKQKMQHSVRSSEKIQYLFGLISTWLSLEKRKKEKNFPTFQQHR